MNITNQSGDDYRRFLDPEVISKLSSLDLVARLVVEGFITGLHRSPYRGFSVEFAEYRPYMPGDPIRDIDWKAYGKSDRLYVKEYEEETNLKAYILLDKSGSMGPTLGHISPFEYGTYLAAALCELMLRQLDAVGLVIFGEGIQSYIPPKSTRSHLHVILKSLSKIQPDSQDSSVSDTFHELAEKIKRRGLIIVISDLDVSARPNYNDPAQVMSGLKHFRHKKHEVIVFHTLNKEEIRFDIEPSKIIGMEGGQEFSMEEPWHYRYEFRALVAKFVEYYRRTCRENLIDYVLIDTSQSFDLALFNYLAKRKRLW